MRPLGTLGSWIRDGMLAGALLPPTSLVALLLVLTAIEGGAGPEMYEFGTAMVVSSFAGAGLALLTAPVSWWVASLTWKMPLLSLSLGPALGAGCAWAAFWFTSVVVDGRAPRFRPNELLLLLGFGALTVGMPWVGYLAVRGKGRSGTPVVAAAVVWGACCAAALVWLAWARRTWLGW